MAKVVTLIARDDHVVCERCKVAETPFTRLAGLLGRRELPVGEGLLLRPAPSIHTFFMRFAIDVVYLDYDFTVLGATPNVKPWRFAGRYGTRAILELPAGEWERQGIQPGERLRLVGEPEGDDDRVQVVLASKDRRFVRVTSFLLARRGCVVHTAADARELIALAEEGRVDVVLIDAARSLTAAARRVAAVQTLLPEAAIVVATDGVEPNVSGQLDAVPKWRSLDRVLQEVERLRAPSGGPELAYERS
jgi:uncharacterized protein